MRTKLLVVSDEDIFVFMFSILFLHAEEETTDSEIVIETEAVAEEGQDQAPQETDSVMITLEFKEADIHNVLKIISRKAGVNIVAAPEVEGTVTMRLADVQWEKALDIILKTYGLAYEKQGDKCE